MSEGTKTALDNAIAAHIADLHDGLVTGYIMQISYFSTATEDHGTSGYYVEVADNQAFHVGLGLSNMLKFHYESLYYEDGDTDD